MKNNTLSQMFTKSLVLFLILSSLFIDASAQIGGYSFPPDPILTGAGSLDLTFGKNGLSTTHFGNSDSAQSVVLQEDGKIIVAGYGSTANTSTLRFSLVRLNTDGSLDSSFGSEGKVQTSFDYPFDGSAVPLTAVLQNDGKIVVAGCVFEGGNHTQSLALARYNSDGSLDASFGINGKLINQFGDNSSIFSMAIQNDNKIVAVGYSMIPNISPYIIVRYNENGTFDNSFGDQGIVRQSEINPSSVILQPDGKIVIGGIGLVDLKLDRNTTIPKRVFGLVRLNTDGTIDNSFGTNGISQTEFSGRLNAQITSIILQPDGKIVAAGFTTDRLLDYRNQHSALVRYNSDGLIDTTFGNNGQVITRVSATKDSITSIKIQSDGKIVAAGSSYYAGIDKFEVSLLRYNTDGNLDSSFGNAGIAITQVKNRMNIVNSLAIQNDGKIVVVGEGMYNTHTNFTDSYFQVFRFNTNDSNNSLMDSMYLNSK